VGYSDAPEVGEACDADFGFRLATLGCPFYFVNKYTAAYRSTEQSVSSDGLKVLLAKLYFLVRNAVVPAEVEPFRRKRLRELAPVAATGCLLMGSRRQCVSVLLSADYGLRRWLSPIGMMRTASLCLPTSMVRRIERGRAARAAK
jgi:hypothetical protein